MKKIDARKLSSSAVEEKWRQTVKLRKKGMTRAQIGEIVGGHADTVVDPENAQVVESTGCHGDISGIKLPGNR